MNKFKLCNKTVIFESVFNNEKMSKCFYSFLDKEKNTEPYDFILEINKVKDLIEEKCKFKKYKELCDTFIKVNSLKELNLSAQIRKDVLNFFEENKEIKEENEDKKKINTIEQLYEKVIFIVKSDFLNDSFPRFIRTKTCFELLYKLQNDDKVLIDYVQKQFPYSEEDFQYYMVTEKDIQFLKYLSNESYDFKLIKSIKEYQYNIYLSLNLIKYLPNLKLAKNAGTNF
jgi:hypothetical protein